MGRLCSSSEHTNRSKMTSATSNMSITTDVDVDSVNESDPSKSGRSERPKKERKTVQFSDVSLREYHLCLGDNPAVARGAPITLDWKYKSDLRYSIEEFEESEHCSARDGPKTIASLKRPSLERLHLLKNLGYSRREIKEATDDAEVIKKQRFKTRRQIERNEKIRNFLYSIHCYCLPESTFCDVDNADKILSESISTVSTRNSNSGSIEWSTVAEASTSRNRRKRKRKRVRILRMKRKKKQDWQEQLQQQWEEGKWRPKRKRKPRDSLDLARHPSFQSLDLGQPVDLGQDASIKSAESNGSLDMARHSRTFNLDELAQD